MALPLTEWVILSIRVALAVMLTVAAGAKLGDRGGFSRTLLSLGIGVQRPLLAYRCALVVPSIELIVALWVVSGEWPRSANVAMVVLMATFTSIAAYGLWRAPTATCHCFGGLNASTFSVQLLLRNLVLVGLALVVAVSGVTPSIASTPVWFMLITLAGYVIVALVAMHAVTLINELKGRMAS